MPVKRVLVTGASGFIGRWSVPALLRFGYEVHAVRSGASSRGAPDEHRGLPDELRRATLHTADLLDAAEVDELLREVKPTHLLHFAWIATPGVYWSSPDNFRWLSASEHLLRAFRLNGGRRVMMAGSCAEYDWARVGVCEETGSPLASEAAGALSPYAGCKIALQSTLADFGRKEHLSTAWGRIFFQFGPYESAERLVPSVIRNLLLNREAPSSHGNQIRSFLHAADVGEAFAAVLDSELEGPVNIGSDERIAIKDLLARISRQVGRADLLRVGARPAAPGEPPLLVPDICRLRDEAGWRPRFTLDQGLSDAIAWWRGYLASGSGVSAG
jgi:nucleoside-diphosphate-sugar epimerase